MLSTKLSHEVRHIGLEQQPILIIDDFVRDAKSLIDYAMTRQDVAPATGHYPGLRSQAPQLYQTCLVSSITELLHSTFSLDSDQLKQADSYFSVVATPVRELSVIQQLAHFDQPKEHELAVIHYLCNESHGGTSFYRHRSSGYEYINQSRHQAYLTQLEQEVSHRGASHQAKYLHGDDEIFERIFSVPAKFNRAVIYRCSSLHSGDIPSDYQFDMNPYTGRFTIASFVHG
ncbi:DUF6445 family protein [Paraglaciecola aquimarina]|uniref:DUF6445 family protein n=1 Tax=Paraglaciecola aquimarina TaxID=1235557 RepID=A0ABU3SRY4_9ALTE|nr:DUF6445 family protein [Paraglaciecola aquimarina]MDU0352743.1 DUF6445 family protein [Paraglaciecola aquimarina]